jgi:hypothetical protein
VAATLSAVLSPLRGTPCETILHPSDWRSMGSSSFRVRLRAVCLGLAGRLAGHTCTSTAPCTINGEAAGQLDREVSVRQRRSSRGSIGWGLCRVRAGQVLDRGSTAACPADGTPVTGRPRVSVLEGGRWSTTSRDDRHLSDFPSMILVQVYPMTIDTDRVLNSGSWKTHTAGWVDRGGICQSEVIGTVCRQRGCWVVITGTTQQEQTASLFMCGTSRVPFSTLLVKPSVPVFHKKKRKTEEKTRSRLQTIHK